MSYEISFISFLKNLYHKKHYDKRPKIKVTWSGATYALPEEILQSENAKKQIRELKKTGIVKNIKESKEEYNIELDKVNN